MAHLRDAKVLSFDDEVLGSYAVTATISHEGAYVILKTISGSGEIFQYPLEDERPAMFGREHALDVFHCENGWSETADDSQVFPVQKMSFVLLGYILYCPYRYMRHLQWILR